MKYEESVRAVLQPLLGKDFDFPYPLETVAFQDVPPDDFVAKPPTGWWRVEPLLSEGNRLLERCVAYDAEWRRLHERNLLFAVERFRQDHIMQLFSSGAFSGSFLSGTDDADDLNPESEASILREIAQNTEDTLRTFRATQDEAEKHFRQLAFLPESPLSSGTRLRQLKRLFRLDYKQAVSRLSAVANGLEKVYGLKLPFPANTLHRDPRQSLLFRLIRWSREATYRLLDITELEQETHLSVSLKNHVPQPESAGGKGLLAALKHGGASIHLPYELLPEHGQVRLRGLGLSVVFRKSDLKATAPTWHARIRLPKLGTYRQELPDGEQQIQVIEQNIPTIDLGRVSAVDSGPVNFVAHPLLFNASPFSHRGGPWKIAIRQSSSSAMGNLEAALKGVEDLILELKIASIPIVWRARS